MKTAHTQEQREQGSLVDMGAANHTYNWNGILARTYLRKHLAQHNYSAGTTRFSNLKSSKSEISAMNARMAVRKTRPSKPQA